MSMLSLFHSGLFSQSISIQLMKHSTLDLKDMHFHDIAHFCTQFMNWWLIVITS